MHVYPCGYYLLDASVARLFDAIAGGSLYATFLGARFFGVGLLGITVVISYAIFATLGFSPRDRLLATIAVGTFPLTSWISGYIQPDDLAACLFEAALLFALRCRTEPNRISRAALLGLALAALAFVKYHYALVALLAFVPVILTSRSQPRIAIRVIALVVVFPLTCAWVCAHSIPPTLTVSANRSEASHIEIGSFAYNFASTTFSTLFGGLLGHGGTTFESFWLHEGIRDGTYFNGVTRSIVRYAIAIATLLTFAIVCARQIRVIRRLGAIARAGRVGWAVRLATCDFAINAYVVLTLFLLAASSARGATFPLQGRYWYLVLVPIVLFSTRSLPRAFAPAARERVRALALGTWLAYCGVGSVAAFAAMHREYYGPQRTLLAEAGAIESVWDGARGLADNARVAQGDTITIVGTAVDSSQGLPAADVRVRVDTTMLRATTGLPSPMLPVLFNVPEVASAGFRANVPTGNLPLGLHRLDVVAIERRAPNGLSIGSFSFTVVAAR
jgi:hypothetical protein